MKDFFKNLFSNLIIFILNTLCFLGILNKEENISFKISNESTKIIIFFFQKLLNIFLDIRQKISSKFLKYIKFS